MASRYSIFSLLRETFRGHRGWEPAWRDAEPRANYDVIIVGGGGHGLATAYYLAKNHGIRNVAVVEKGYIGSGNVGRNTTIVRSNYLLPGNVPFYEWSLKLWEGLEQDGTACAATGQLREMVINAGLGLGEGVVSGTVLIYTPWPADDWNELDIEYLGAFADRMQFNAMVYTGAPVQPPVTVSVTPTQFPQTVSLGFDASADFHVYGIEWTPSGVTYTVDGVAQATWSSQIGRMTLPQNILLTAERSRARLRSPMI